LVEGVVDRSRGEVVQRRGVDVEDAFMRGDDAASER